MPCYSLALIRHLKVVNVRDLCVYVVFICSKLLHLITEMGPPYNLVIRAS